MLILGILCILFNKNHPELVGGTEDPEDGKEVAATAGMAIAIYAVSLPTMLGKFTGDGRHMKRETVADNVNDTIGILHLLRSPRVVAFARG